MHRLMHAFLPAAALASVVACGGSSTTTTDLTDPGSGQGRPPSRPVPNPATRIEFENLTINDALHAPVTARNGTVRVGPPVMPTSASAPPATVHAGHTVRSTTIRDGTSAASITRYLEQGHGFLPQISMSRPKGPLLISLSPNARGKLDEYVIRSVQLINAWLPASDRMTVSPVAGPTVADNFSGARNEIPIELDELFPGAAGQAHYGGADGRRIWGYIEIAHDTLDRIAAARTGQAREDAEDQLMHTIVHEIIHVLGLEGHPDKANFPNSAMSHSLKWNPGDVLFPVDSDVLTASFTVIRPVANRNEMVSDLGAWNETSTHLFATVGATQDTWYGVRARGAFIQPWFEGSPPHGPLAGNQTLSGSATWSGRLLGLTPQLESVAGAARLVMDLASLTGDLAFTDLEYWATPTPSVIGTGAAWGTTSLEYTVAASGNRFVNTSGDDGQVTGVFTGASHETMGGTLERPDLVAAFAGER